MLETMAYAQERYAEMITRGVETERSARIRETEAVPMDEAIRVPWIVQARTLLARQLWGLGTRLALPPA